MKDHLVKSEEIRSCYCGTDLMEVQWKSEFSSHQFYKTVICECGRKNRVKMKYYGSGHDKWTPQGFDDKVEAEHKRLR